MGFKDQCCLAALCRPASHASIARRSASIVTKTPAMPSVARTSSILPIVVATLAVLLQPVASVGTYTAVFMSDLHYDPYYGTGKAYKCSDQSNLRSHQYGQPGCDTPATLMISAIDDARALAPSAVFIGGDWLRHAMDELPSSDVDLTLNGVAYEVSLIDSNETSVVNWAIGNDDLVPDYHFNVSKLLQLRTFGNVMLDNGLISAAEKATFEDCGHFFRDVFSLNMRVISLNTILWSTRIQPPISPSDTDPCGQLRFLRNSILEAIGAGLHVIILGHIPPGLDVHGVITSGFSSGSMFWLERFQTSFLEIVHEYEDHIPFMLFGHTHMLSFIADTATLPTIPIYVIPSIAPSFGNNPSYLIATVDAASGQVQKLRHRVFSLSTLSWSNGAELSATFGIENVWNVSNLANAANDLLRDGSISSTGVTREAFLNIYASGGNLQPLFLSGGTCDGACALVLYCSMQHVTFVDIQRCTSIPEYASARESSPATIFFTVLSVLMFAISLGIAMVRRDEMTAVPPVGREPVVRSVPTTLRRHSASEIGPTSKRE